MSVVIKQYTDVSLLKRNTFGIEAKAARLVEFSSVDALVDFLAGGFSGKSLVIGGGSNLLFVDDFDGTVFHSTIMDIDVVAAACGQRCQLGCTCGIHR